MGPADDAAGVAVRVLAGLDERGIPCALGGALALNWWSEPRGTLDADINVFVEPERYAEVLDAFSEIGVRFDAADWRRRFDAGHVAIGYLGQIRVDVFVPSIPFYDTAASRVVRAHVHGADIPVLDASTLAVFKLLFARPKDFVDLETLLRRSRAHVDTTWVRQQVADMVGDDDERVRRWDALVGEVK